MEVGDCETQHERMSPGECIKCFDQIILLCSRLIKSNHLPFVEIASYLNSTKIVQFDGLHKGTDGSIIRPFPPAGDNEERRGNVLGQPEQKAFPHPADKGAGRIALNKSFVPIDKDA